MGSRRERVRAGAFGALRWFGLIAAMLLVVACSSDGPAPVEERADASLGDASSGATPTSKAIVAATTLARADTELARRLAPVGDGFRETKDGVTSPGWRSAATERAYHVGARLPATADAPFEAGLGVSDLYRLTLEPLGASAAPLALDHGRAAYERAYPDTDVVFVAEPARLEWMYVLHAEGAPHELRVRVTLPKNLPTIEARADGSLAVIDDAGNERLRMPRPVAIDAHGERRDARLAWEDGTLTVSLDPTGLAYPVLLDPAIETAAWELRNARPIGRNGHAMAYDPVRQRVVLFGGSAGDDLGDTWEFDGSVWSLRSTAGPSARAEAAAAYDPVQKRVALFGGGPTSGDPYGDMWLWDGTAWTQTCTGSCTRPSPRAGASMVLDSARSRLVLFGGVGAGGTSLGDTWEWNGSAWTNVSTTGPSARGYAGMAYDAARAQTVLFGGSSGGNETWVWNGTAWSQKAVSGPSARYWMGMGYHADSALVVLYGGWASGTDETWTWNGTAWAKLSPSPNAGLHYDFGLVYAASLHTLVLFGGNGSGETWEWDGTKWFEPPTLPAPRTGPALTYDSSTNRTVLYGGSTSGERYDTWEWDGFSWTNVCTSPACVAALPYGSYPELTFDSTRKRRVLVTGAGPWVFEWTGSAWQRQCTTSPCTSTVPGARYGFALAYDSARQKTLLFGGLGYSTGVVQNDLWSWDGMVWTQLCTTPACSSAAPPARMAPAAAFDSTRNVLVVIGGDGANNTLLDDVWEWDGTQWTQKCTAPSCSTSRPSKRYSAAATFDSVRARVILNGGFDFNLSPGVFGDTWEWDGTAFVQTDAGSSSSMPNRYGHGAAFDRVRRRAVFFGGYGGGSLGDTWEYHVHGNSCAAAASCTTGFCVDGVCCESAQCGTCQACNTATGSGVCTAVTNADDLDSCTGTDTCDVFGRCKKKLGSACSAASECASGFCADGYCCNAACAGGCDVCSASPGTCTPLAKGATGSNPVCGGYLCDGASGACPGTCAADADCASGYFCAAGGVCQAQRGAGLSCNTASSGDCKTPGCRECTGTLTCKDGVCCNGACNGPCQTCASTTPGTCTTVKSADDSDTCTGTNTCSATGSCLVKLGQACSSNAQCASGFCADGVCCNGACSGGCDVCKASLGATADGQCTLLAAGATGTGCGNYVCTGASGACPSSCSSDSACLASAYCNTGSGTCQPDQTNGGACTTGAQCASGSCVDGFCCNNACTGLCQACSAGKTGLANGTCGNVTAGTDPDDECAQAPATTCQKDGFCDGAGACRLYASGTTCGSPTCTAGVASTSTCNGTGTCGSSQSSCSPYACNGTACATSCTSDANCQSGFYCATGGTCQAKKAQGAACAAQNECAGGNCVDGVCCDTACNQKCQACTAAKKGSGADGACGPVKADADPDNECDATGGTCGQTGNCNGAGACKIAAAGTVCGTTSCTNGVQSGQQCDGAGTCSSGSSTTCTTGYACLNANVCATSCTDDGQCAGGYFCSAGSCVAAQAIGAKCSRARQCAGGNCIDGVCCDGVCTGTCQACSNAKTGQPDGQCKPVAADTDPDNECAATTQSSCQENGSCDGSGACKKWPFGTVCGANACAGPTSLTGQQCDGIGGCIAGQTTPCDPYVCAGTACLTGCNDDTSCAPGAFCGNDSACHVKLGLAAACTSSHECKSGFCVEGVCCNTACDGICQACTQATKQDGTADGTCAFAKTGADPHGDCADDRIGAPTSCAHDGLCDGAGACRYYAKGTACGQTSCTGNVQTGHACDGTGTCLDDATQDCGDYACIVGACTTSCTKDADCSATAYCDTATSACKPKSPLGGACTNADTCASGFCADGVCCNRACDGQCEACDASGSKGTCSPIVGVPRPSRKPCAGAPDETPDGTCQARRCDGTTGDSCNGYVGSDVGCRDQSCSGGIESFSATCSGQGYCGVVSDAVQTKPCEPYACGATACKDKCAADGDCAPGYKCDTASGKCVTGAECDGDHTIKAPGQAPTDCRPYKCESGGTCKSSCASVDDCVDGFVCDQNSQCAAPTVVEASPSDSGGCGCRVAGGERESRTAAAWLLSGLAALVVVRRRRRAGRAVRLDRAG